MQRRQLSLRDSATRGLASTLPELAVLVGEHDAGQGQRLQRWLASEGHRCRQRRRWRRRRGHGLQCVGQVLLLSTHTHTHRVGSASHRNNYVSTTRTHFVVPSQSQSLYICPFTLAQFSFHFTCFSPFFLCFPSLFRFLRMLLACVSNFYIFRFLFMSLFFLCLCFNCNFNFPFVDFQFRLHFLRFVCKVKTNKPHAPRTFVSYLGTHLCQCKPLDVECAVSVVSCPGPVGPQACRY